MAKKPKKRANSSSPWPPVTRSLDTRWGIAVPVFVIFAAIWGIEPAWGQEWMKQLSAPTHTTIPDIDVKVPVRDGVKLSTDLYIPSGGGKFSTILLRTPYDNNSMDNVRDGLYFSERGYVLAI